MRIRFKKWARPELEASKFYIDNPEDYKGKWGTLFKKEEPLHLELGCGKGGFISELALKNQDINYVAVDNKLIEIPLNIISLSKNLSKLKEKTM